MVVKDEDEIIWMLFMNKDIMKKELGFGKYIFYVFVFLWMKRNCFVLM